MNKHIIATAVAFTIALVSSFSSLAQSRIDRIVKDLEKAHDVEVTYTERRDPKTKKLIKQSIILSGNSRKQYDQLWDAFEQERSNSVSVTKTRNRSFIIKFQDKNVQSSYVLSESGGSSWSLVVTKRDNNCDDRDLSFNDFDFDFDFDFGDFAFNGLEGLGSLGELGELGKLGELGNLKDLDKLNDLNGLNADDFNGDVTVYDSEGNVIYKSKSNSSKGNSRTIIKSNAKSAAKSGAKSKSHSKSTSTSISINGSNSVRTVTTSDNGKTTTTTYYL